MRGAQGQCGECFNPVELIYMGLGIDDAEPVSICKEWGKRFFVWCMYVGVSEGQGRSDGCAAIRMLEVRCGDVPLYLWNGILSEGKE